MNDDTVISVEQVSKKYCKSLKRSMYYGLQDVLRNSFGLPAHSECLRSEEFWALDAVSFELKKGQTLGIIGPNGSGKTTLLKLLNGIFWPDKGKISVRGRVGALIEVGAGFHPLLSGRDNIYINAAILGMTKAEVDKKFDAIVDFADIGDFLDTPVKYYSSGMFVRLGFAVAVHCEPDVLLIDEVLAVGDMDFRRKCLDALRTLHRGKRTLVFVSHDLTQVESICSDVLWLDHGRKAGQGAAPEVVSTYLTHVQDMTGRGHAYPGARWGSYDAEIIQAQLTNSDNQPADTIVSGEETVLNLKIRFNKDIDDPIFGMIIRGRDGLCVYGTNTRWQHMKCGSFKSGSEIIVSFRQKMSLCRGVYSISPAIAYAEGMTFCDWRDNAVVFSVTSPIQIEGIIDLNSRLSVHSFSH